MNAEHPADTSPSSHGSIGSSQDQTRRPSLPSIQSLFGLRREDDLEVLLDDGSNRRGSADSSRSAGPSAMIATPPSSHRKPQQPPASTFQTTASAEQSNTFRDSFSGPDLPAALSSRLLPRDDASSRRSSMPSLESFRQHRMHGDGRSSRGGVTSPVPLSPPESPQSYLSGQHGIPRRGSLVARSRSRGGSPAQWFHSPMSSISSTTSTSSFTSTPANLHSAGPQPLNNPLPLPSTIEATRSRSFSDSQPGLAPSPDLPSLISHHPYQAPQSASRHRSDQQEPLPPPSAFLTRRHHLHFSGDAGKRRHTISETSGGRSSPRPQSPVRSPPQASSALHSRLESYRLPPVSGTSSSAASGDEHLQRQSLTHHAVRPPPSSSRTHPSLLSFASQMAPSSSHPPPPTRPSTSPSASRSTGYGAPPSSYRRMSSALEHVESPSTMSSAQAQAASYSSPLYGGGPRPRSATTTSDPPSADEALRPLAAESAGSSSSSTTTGSAGMAKYECAYCRKRFNRPSSLKIHVNTHTGEKPFKCPFAGCGRRFSVMSNMRRHARVHSQSRMSDPHQHGDEDDDREGDGDGTGRMDAEAEGDETPFAWSSGPGPSAVAYRTPIARPSSQRAGSSHSAGSTIAMPIVAPAFGVIHHHHHYYHSHPPSSPEIQTHPTAATFIPATPDQLSSGAQRLFYPQVPREKGMGAPSTGKRTPDMRPPGGRRAEGALKRSKSNSNSPAPTKEEEEDRTP